MPTLSPVARPTVRRLAAVLALLVASLAVLGAPAGALARSDRLTSAQEREVLRLVDGICGDTWCEGDHAFRFRRFACRLERAECALGLQVASWSEQPLRWQWRTEPVCGFHRYADMVATSPDGWTSLQPAFLTAVSEAVAAIEADADVRAVRDC